MGGKHTTPADPGLPKPPNHTAHSVGHDTVCGSTPVFKRIFILDQIE